MRVMAMTALVASGLVFHACGGNADDEGSGSVSLRVSSVEELEIPEEGTPGERLEALWSQTRPLVERDAGAGYDDAEYQARRQPIWRAWTSLQMSVAGEDDRVSEIIPRVLELINQVYGWTAFSPEERAKKRSNKARTAGLIEEIDQEIGKL